MTNSIIILRKENENAASLYRRFVKQFRSSGIQLFVRRNKYCMREPSKSVRKKDCMNRLEKRRKFEEAYRMGKISSYTVYHKK